MESFRILALLSLISFISFFSLENANAQASQERCNLSTEITTKSLSKHDTSFMQKYGSYLLRMSNNDLLKISTSISEYDVILAGQSPSASDTFNGKLERLTGKPIIDTLMVYYYPLKRIYNSSIYNSQLYRTSAIIFNMIMIAKYPYISRKNDY